MHGFVEIRTALPRYIISGAVLLLLNGCGGSGGGAGSEGAQSNSMVSGFFVDSAVDGLSYRTSTGLTGTTSSGMFNFSPDSNITFSVGNASLGTATAKAFLSPSDLVPGGGTMADSSVTNLVRFLLALDSSTVTDDIVISDAVRDAALTWPSVDVRSVNLDSDSGIQAILSSVAAADNRTVTLPSVATAQAHFRATVRCMNGGGYQGTWNGDYQQTGAYSARWSLVIDPVTGDIMGHQFTGAETPENATSKVFLSGNLSDVGSANLSLQSPSGTITTTGELAWRSIRANWSDTSSADTGDGTLEGRAINSTVSQYRGVIRGNGTEALYVSFVLGPNGSGSGINLFDGARLSVTWRVVTVVGTGQEVRGELRRQDGSSAGNFAAPFNADPRGSFTGTYSGSAVNGVVNGCAIPGSQRLAGIS